MPGLPVALKGRWKARFESFLDHFKKEMGHVGDDSLAKELDVLSTLASKGEQFQLSSSDGHHLLALWQYEVPCAPDKSLLCLAQLLTLNNII